MTNSYPNCPRCGRTASGEPLEDGSFWCSWCGQAFGLGSENDSLSTTPVEAPIKGDLAEQVAFYGASPNKLTANDLVAILEACPAERRAKTIRELAPLAETDIASQSLTRYLDDPDAMVRMAALEVMVRNGQLPFATLEAEFRRQIADRCIARPLLAWLAGSQDSGSTICLLESFKAFHMPKEYTGRVQGERSPASVVEALKENLGVVAGDSATRQLANAIVSLFSEEDWQLGRHNRPRISDEALRQRKEALDTLSAIHDTRAAPAILHSLSNYIALVYDPDLRGEQYLSWLENNPTLTAYSDVLRRMADEDEYLLWLPELGDSSGGRLVVRVLGDIGMKRSLSVLLQMCEDVLERRTWSRGIDTEALSAAASICRRMGPDAAGDSANRLREILIILSSDSTDWLSSKAAESLTKMN